MPIGWMAKATHPSKPCRMTSALTGHAYTSAGQAARRFTPWRSSRSSRPTSSGAWTRLAQVFSLSALPPSDEGQELKLLCPIRALKIYLERSALFRQSDQLFVCFCSRTKGRPVMKQRLSRWIVDARAATTNR